MATSATILTLHQLTDAALMGPELGTVNFKLLHSILQIIINQVGIDDVKVEFKGSESELIQKMIDPNAQGGIKATQYNITHDSAKKSNKIDRDKIRMMVVGEEAGEKEIKVIDRRKDSKEDPDPAPPQFSSPPLSSVVIVPTNGNGTEVTPAFTVALTTEAFAKLTGDVEDLKEKYGELTQMSNNSDLMNAVRSSTGGEAPIVDMYQVLTLTKRVEAAEIGMAKMASIIEDLAREQINNTGEGTAETAEHQKPDSAVSGGTTPTSRAPSAGGRAARSKVIENAVKLRSSIDGGNGPISENLREIERRVTELEKKIDAGGVPVTDSKQGTHLPKLGETGGPVLGKDYSKLDFTKVETEDALVMIQREFKNIRNVIQTLDVPGLQKQIEDMKKSGGRSRSPSSGGAPGSTGGGDISERMVQMEAHFNQCIEQINSLDRMFHDSMETVGKQVASIERELGKVYEKMQGMPDQEGGDGTQSETNVLELYKRFTELENITNNIGQTAAELLDERQERQIHMAALKEQVEMLKTIKADKSEVEGQLADKVDICMINRKVSHEQFDATCMDLTKGIEDALEKLTKQEELWQQALTDIQAEVGSKLDKMELGPLKEFITGKLGSLQGKLKALSKLKKEQEAAGTKAALLKDVKCISCDNDVVMRKNMDPTLYPQPPSLPPTKTMAPYLAYELDQLRKQQKTLGNSRNLNHFEQIIKKGESCNRYCGGSHTLTTPQQRVTRMGHFLEQWGPEISIANDSEIKGKDGMIYRGEEKILASVAKPLMAARNGRPSITIQGDILSNRPGFEMPEKLSGSKTQKPEGGSKTGFVSFNESEENQDT